MTAVRKKSSAQLNAECLFSYLVSATGGVRWFPTKAEADKWNSTHKTEGNTYVLAHHPADAVRRAAQQKES